MWVYANIRKYTQIYTQTVESDVSGTFWLPPTVGWPVCPFDSSVSDDDDDGRTRLFSSQI